MPRLIVLLSLFLSLSTNALELRGRVVAITDGDTLTILDEHSIQRKIRLAGIDAPEKSQPFGQNSKYELSQLAFRRYAIVEYKKLDRYGRYVGKVIVDGRDVCLEQLRSGHAWIYDDYIRELSPSDLAEYRRAMRSAKASREGLWRDPEPTPPWVYRRDRRNR